MNASRQYVYIVRPLRVQMLSEGPTKFEAKVLDDHLAYLKGLAANEVVILAGRTQIADERAFGVVILQAASDLEARELMENDPAVSRGIMLAELYPYKIAVSSFGQNE